MKDIDAKSAIVIFFLEGDNRNIIHYVYYVEVWHTHAQTQEQYEKYMKPWSHVHVEVTYDAIFRNGVGRDYLVVVTGSSLQLGDVRLLLRHKMKWNEIR